MDNEKIEFIWDTVVEEIAGKQGVEKLILKNAKTGEKSELAVDGVFVFIGHRPNVELFETQVALADDRTIQTDRRTRTNLPGVFACGDVQDSIYRQAITAAGSGCQSAIEAESTSRTCRAKPTPGNSRDKSTNKKGGLCRARLFTIPTFLASAVPRVWCGRVPFWPNGY